MYDAIRDAVVSGSELAARQMAYEPGFKVLMPETRGLDSAADIVTMANREIEGLINQIVGQKVTDISNDTMLRIQAVVGRGLSGGVNPLDIARDIKVSIGLTKRQNGWVENYRSYLENLDPSALRLTLRDRRFDSTVRRAIANGEPLSKDYIDRLVERYSEKALKYRSETIARTEALKAVHAGQKKLFDKYVQSGLLDRNQVRRFWHTSGDLKVREAHFLVPQMNPEGVSLDEPFKTPLGPLMYPGDPDGSPSNIINCRCVVFNRIISKEIADEIASGKRAGPFGRGSAVPGSAAWFSQLRRETGVSGKTWYDTPPVGDLSELGITAATQFRMLPGLLTDAPDFFILPATDQNAARFYELLSSAKEASDYGWMVDANDPEFFKNTLMVLASDGKAGFAITRDLNIVSVFNHPDSYYSGASMPMIRLAVELGGRKLDAFNTVLPDLYAMNGFAPASKLKFDPYFAPDDWPAKELFSETELGNQYRSYILRDMAERVRRGSLDISGLSSDLAMRGYFDLREEWGKPRFPTPEEVGLPEGTIDPNTVSPDIYFMAIMSLRSVLRTSA